MGFAEILSHLWQWTPFLARGFMWNILISIVAMVAGSLLGWWFAAMRASPRVAVARTSGALTEFVRNVPTFVFQFYLVFILPIEVVLPHTGIAIPIPAWLKAAMALALAVTGFVSDNLLAAIREWRSDNHVDAMLFIPNWANYFVIIVMASSTASVIGVGELVSSCNTVVNAVGKTQMILWVYLYAMLWFFAFCYPVMHGMQLVRAAIGRRPH